MPGTILGIENMYSYKHMDKQLCLLPGIIAAMETEVIMPRWRREAPKTPSDRLLVTQKINRQSQVS